MAQDFKRFEQGCLQRAVLPGSFFHNRLEQPTLLACRQVLLNSLTCAASSESASPFKASGGPSESSPLARSRRVSAVPSLKATARSIALRTDRDSSRYSAAHSPVIGSRFLSPAATMRVTAFRIHFLARVAPRRRVAWFPT